MAGARNGEESKPLLRKTTTNEDGVEESKAGCCNPRAGYYRFVVLVLICFLSFGSYFCYDNPAALEEQIQHAMGVNVAEYALLYALYSWPNVILCFFGGFLIDRYFGVRWGAGIFGGFVLAGQCLFAIGAQANLYSLMLAGRFVFGIGGESLAVAQNTYAVNWFKGKELNMVFGVQLSFSRVGSTLNMNIMQHVYNAFSTPTREPWVALGYALWIGALMCIFSLSCAAVLAFLDKRKEKITKASTAGPGEVIRVKDVKDFPAELWLIFLICVAYYVAVFPFIGLGMPFFEAKFGLSGPKASAVNSLVYLISAGASPVFGYLVDKTGCNLIWCICSTASTLGAHMLMAFTFLNPYIAMTIMGFSYSVLACALWPMVAYIVPKHQLGTAYGFMQSVQNLGLAVVAQVAGIIANQSGYLRLELFFCMCLCVALLGCTCLYVVDSVRGGRLNATAKMRAARESEEAKAKEADVLNINKSD